MDTYIDDIKDVEPYDLLTQRINDIEMLIDIDSKIFRPYTINLKVMLKQTKDELHAYELECQNAH